jgi:hypothetical protein
MITHSFNFLRKIKEGKNTTVPYVKKNFPNAFWSKKYCPNRSGNRAAVVHTSKQL